jgi:phosphate:Na+ symporter
LAAAHLIFNVTTAAIAILIMDHMITAVSAISEFIGIAADNHTLKLAVFDSLFKIMGVVIFIPFVDKLVIFLQSRFKPSDVSETKSFDTVKYLNESVLGTSMTTMAAIRKETKHLYDNAFEIIIHGLNIKRSNILSDMPLEEVVKDLYSQSPVDIDDFYHRNIKGIYGEIIDFSTKAQSQMAHEEIEELYKIKLANRDIVEAVKDTKHLQKNLVKYAKSTNTHIKSEYDSMRKDLAELLRTINLISLSDQEDEILLLLSKAKIHTERYDIIANGKLDNLIRNRLISNEMATSLMNDSGYAYNISTNLIAMAEIIYVTDNSEMLIEEEDIKEILDQKDEQ